MYNIILVDDEPYVLDQIAQAINWENVGFNLSGIFSDATKALDFLEYNHIDAIISDIKMPKTDGLEFAKICSEKYPNLQFSIISAFKDFEYAKTAIKYNVAEYLTKPIIYDEFISCLKKMHLNLDYISENSEFPDDKTQKNIQKIFSDIFLGFLTDEKRIETEFENINITLKCEFAPCAIINLRIVDYENFIKTKWKHEQHQLYNAISYFIPFEKSGCYSCMFRYHLDNADIILFGNKIENLDSIIEQVSNETIANSENILNLNVEISTIRFYKNITEIIQKNDANMEILQKPEYNDIITLAIKYINENYSQQLTLSNVAKQVNLSSIYFCSYFKKYTNVTFKNYLMNYRLEKAKELLTNTEIKISAVCEMIGYKNQTYFYNIFQNKTGLTPAQYRNTNSDKN